jgi:hypothetical protein
VIEKMIKKYWSIALLFTLVVGLVHLSSANPIPPPKYDLFLDSGVIDYQHWKGTKMGTITSSVMFPTNPNNPYQGKYYVYDYGFIPNTANIHWPMKPLIHVGFEYPTNTPKGKIVYHYPDGNNKQKPSDWPVIFKWPYWEWYDPTDSFGWEKTTILPSATYGFPSKETFYGRVVSPDPPTLVTNFIDTTTLCLCHAYHGRSRPGIKGEGGALAPTPEPCTMLLLGTGVAGLFGIARRRKR